MSIRLGSTVRDAVTRFRGVVTGRVEYITNCVQYLVAPPSDGTKLPDTNWIDESRLIVEDVPVLELGRPKTDLGPDKPAPVR